MTAATKLPRTMGRHKTVNRDLPLLKTLLAIYVKTALKPEKLSITQIVRQYGIDTNYIPIITEHCLDRVSNGYSWSWKRDIGPPSIAMARAVEAEALRQFRTKARLKRQLKKLKNAEI